MSTRTFVSISAAVILGTAIGALLVRSHLSKEITQLQLDSAFEIAMIQFKNFKEDVGRYPHSFEEMVTRGNSIPGWKGPYFLMAVEKQQFTLKANDLIFKNGIALRYSELHNGHELRSPGLDGRYCTADDTVEVLH